MLLCAGKAMGQMWRRRVHQLGVWCTTQFESGPFVADRVLCGVGIFVSKLRKLSPLGWVGWLAFQPYKWIVLAPFLLFSTLFFGSLTIVLSFFLPSRWVSLICGVFWSRLNAWLTPMRVKVKGRENVDPQQSYVVVANHQSFYDVFVLYGWLGIDFKWVMKQEMRSLPGLGIGCEKVGHIFIDRTNPGAALKSINSAIEKITNGTSVVFFPEGTRSRDGKLLPLKKGAFRFALDVGLPILPVTIVGTGKILPPDGLDLLPGPVRLLIGKPISVEGLDKEDLQPLMKDVREFFEQSNARSV